MINYDISQNPPAPMLQVTISGVRRTFPHRTMNIFHLYAVKLKLNGITIPRVEVIATDLDIVVVGRDVLNQFYFSSDPTV